MGQAHSIAIRERIVDLRSQGLTFVDISKDTNLPYDTIRKLHKLMTQRNSLKAQYESCGSKGDIRSSSLYYRASVWLKRHHQSWGAPFIRLKLADRYGDKDLPSVRQMQIWFRAIGLNAPRPRHHLEQTKGVSAAHERWQVDAKEQVRLANGEWCCYLSIVDEYTGAALGAPLFPL